MFVQEILVLGLNGHFLYTCTWEKIDVAFLVLVTGIKSPGFFILTRIWYEDIRLYLEKAFQYNSFKNVS